MVGLTVISRHPNCCTSGSCGVAVKKEPFTDPRDDSKLPRMSSRSWKELWIPAGTPPAALTPLEALLCHSAVSPRVSSNCGKGELLLSSDCGEGQFLPGEAELVQQIASEALLFSENVLN